MTMQKLASLAREFESLQECCLYEPQWLPEDVEDVLLFADTDGYERGWTALEEYGGGSEVSALAIVKLKSGKLGLLQSSEDYTGHGCQCNSYTGRYEDLESLLQYGIEEYCRENIRRLLEG